MKIVKQGVLAAGTNNESVFGSMDWEEVSR